jgi:hypothetical protein
MLQKNSVYIGLIFFSLIVSYQYFRNVQLRYLQITSFKECVAAGFRLRATYPEQCVMYGKVFINQDQKKDVVSRKVSPPSTPIPPVDYKNQTYSINGEQVRFSNGKGELSPNQLLKQGTTTLVSGDETFFCMT